MSLSILLKVAPRQSRSSAILRSINPEADSPPDESDFFMSFSLPRLAPGERVLEPVVAPEDLLAHDERRRAEDTLLARLLGRRGVFLLRGCIRGSSDAI